MKDRLSPGINYTLAALIGAGLGWGVHELISNPNASEYLASLISKDENKLVIEDDRTLLTPATTENVFVAAATETPTSTVTPPPTSTPELTITPTRRSVINPFFLGEIDLTVKSRIDLSIEKIVQNPGGDSTRQTLADFFFTPTFSVENFKPRDLTGLVSTTDTSRYGGKIAVVECHSGSAAGIWKLFPSSCDGVRAYIEGGTYDKPSHMYTEAEKLAKAQDLIGASLLAKRDGQEGELVIVAVANIPHDKAKDLDAVKDSERLDYIIEQTKTEDEESPFTKYKKLLESGGGAILVEFCGWGPHEKVGNPDFWEYTRWVFLAIKK